MKQQHDFHDIPSIQSFNVPREAELMDEGGLHTNIRMHKRGSAIVSGKDLEYHIHLEFAKSGVTPSWESTSSITN